MGSGAYSVFIDQQAGGGPAGALRRVVPLPPPAQSGAVKFTTVVLSLAYDNFGEPGAPATIPATVRILRGSGPVQTLCTPRSGVPMSQQQGEREPGAGSDRVHGLECFDVTFAPGPIAVGL